ncbi:TrbG/VirB9 family P-type conjugative transfer protein [Rickettsiella endosymbiont of Dermanyssus gallinae]|uniref:TrbG/VirB9 family P-type conjugative transfer protein n=1 Tax=Rickettsiella endosymbiont of Dermanyssus gallinae TaxID=2856608 RepID=UPI001C52C97B|nr:TrbG/VirB9 family P-type conjugative transfer protein [Rickettsiella endosymbiont of Dermanyssus gallinae]
MPPTNDFTALCVSCFARQRTPIAGSSTSHCFHNAFLSHRMTVLTSANSYNFQLDANDAKISPTYQLKFNYPTAGYDNRGKSNAIGTCDPTQINWKYSFTGDQRLAPIEAFDCNGQFTYFRFKSSLPAIFVVDKKRKETLVNYHVKGNYVVVNTTAEQFTLRSGRYVTSVYNDALLGDWQ